jgi:hypothetical protein
MEMPPAGMRGSMVVEFAWTVGEGETEPVPRAPVVMEAEFWLLPFEAAEPAVWTGALVLAFAFGLLPLLPLFASHVSLEQAHGSVGTYRCFVA